MDEVTQNYQARASRFISDSSDTMMRVESSVACMVSVCYTMEVELMECSTCDYYWSDPATVCGGVCSHLQNECCDFEPGDLGCFGILWTSKGEADPSLCAVRREEEEINR